MKSLKMFTICDVFLAEHLKAVSSLYAILCFLRLSQIWSHEFFYQQAPGRAQIYLTDQQILVNSTEGNAINLA